MLRPKPHSPWLILNLALSVGLIAALSLAACWVLFDSRREPERQARQFQQIVNQGLELSKGNARQLQTLLATLPAAPLFAGLEIHGKTGRLLEIRFDVPNQAWPIGLMPAAPIEAALDPRYNLQLTLFPAPGYSAQRLVAAAPAALGTAAFAFLIFNLTAWLFRKRLRFGQIDESRWEKAMGIEHPQSRKPPLLAPAPAELLDCVPDAILRCDAQGRVTFLNAAARHLLETDQDGQAPAGVLDVIAPWDRARCADLISTTNAPGNPQHLLAQTVGARSGTLPVSIDIMAIPDDTHDRLLTIRDASATHALGETLRLRDVLCDAIPQGLAALSLRDRGEILYANRAFRTLLNLAEAQSGGASWIEQIAGRLAPSLGEQLRAALDRMAAASLELPWQSADGAARTLELQVLPADSAERRVVLCLTDRSNEAARRDRVERDLFLDQKILDEMPLAYCIADAQGTLSAVNSRFVKLMGRPADQLIGTGIADWIDRPVKTQGPIYQGDYALVAEPSGRVAKLSTLPFHQGDYALVAEPTGRVVKLSTLPLLTQQGGSEYVYFFDDITAFKQRALTDNAELERLQRTLDGVEDGIVTTNADGFIQYMNPFAQRLTGLVEHQYKGMAFGHVIHLIDEKKREPLVDPATRAIRIGKTVKFRQDVLLIGENKQELAVDVAATPVHDRTKTVMGSVIVMKDVAEQRSLSHQMHMRASLDPLTGLINRRELLSLLQGLQSETEERSRQHTLCYMDLDKFKAVNDTCGHNAGDELLRQVSNLMSECLRANDVLARIGGDEFCAVFLNTATEHGTAVAEKIRDAVKRFRFTWDGKFFEIGVSIGLFGLQPGLGVEETISAADQACYHAKEQGRDRVYVASAPQRDKGTPPPAPWSERLSAAADHDYFRLFSWDAQALQAGRQSAPTYREVLLQLHEPNQTPLAASAFMPSAQRLNLVPSIERWGIGKLLSRLPPAAPPLDPPVVYAIHLSSVTLADSSFTAFLFEQSKHFGISPQQICFEISEDDLVQNFSLVQSFMLACKKAGYRFCLSQFGGGISSFGYIRNLPLDFLKIDSSLTGRAGSDPIDAAIVRAIQDIGEHIHVSLVAQNVQDQPTREFLSALGIHYGQGPLFSQPIPLEPTRPAPPADAGRRT